MTAYAENTNLKGHFVDLDTKAVRYGYLSSPNTVSLSRYYGFKYC